MAFVCLSVCFVCCICRTYYEEEMGSFRSCGGRSVSDCKLGLGFSYVNLRFTFAFSVTSNS
ncbi:hypothetical protein KC19_11G114400 [Ceratodon purpureus]|uniref:Uncharacterized protein n=1 Tax=Ceratodon purpureus TaxID=3225 RepID=A0A8T0GCX0_CERPU|nr:hypothetical protein KC19_11G114400 [Ceratodon purpureus]